MTKLDDLQVTYDRLIAHRARAIRYFDDCPDGDPRKTDAEKQLLILGERVRDVERQIDEALDEDEAQANAAWVSTGEGTIPHPEED